MTDSAVATIEPATMPTVGAAAGADAIEALIIQGDLAKVSPAQRVAYYRGVCESLGLNPFTRPFDYINLDGKLTLYPKRDATDQLRQTRGITITRLERQDEDQDGITRVVAHARDIHGREDEATGEVYTKQLSGQPLANARMKAETKAKRRVTLSLVGLGWLDESEIEAARAVRVVVDMNTGEIAAEDAARLAAIPTASDRLAQRRALIEAASEHPDSAAADASPPGDGADGEPAPSAAVESTTDVVEGEATEVDEAPSQDPGRTWSRDRFRDAVRAAGIDKQRAADVVVEVGDGRTTTDFGPPDWEAAAKQLGLA